MHATGVQFIASSQDFASTAEHAGNRCLQCHRSALGILRKSAAPQPKKGCRSDQQVWEWQSWSTSVGFESANGLHRQCEHPNAIRILGKDGESQDMWASVWQGNQLTMQNLQGMGSSMRKDVLVERLSWCLARGAGIWRLELWLDGVFFPTFSLVQAAINVNTCSFSSVHGTGFSIFFDVHATWTSHDFTSKDFKTLIACKAGSAWDDKLILWFVRVPPLFMLARIHSVLWSNVFSFFEAFRTAAVAANGFAAQKVPMPIWHIWQFGVDYCSTMASLNVKGCSEIV